MIGLSLHMASDCCRAEDIQPGLYIDVYTRIHTSITIYIYSLVAL